MPVQADGFHNPGTDCSGAGCHGPGGAGGEFVLGGTVYQADGATPAANVQVGIDDGVASYYVYSGANGNFWVTGSSTAVTWANAEVRIRNANGEKSMGPTSPGAWCNNAGCHESGSVLVAP